MASVEKSAKNAISPMSDGARIVSEVAHIIKFMKSMGYNTEGLSVDNVLSLRARLKEELVVCGHIQNQERVKDAFK